MEVMDATDTERKRHRKRWQRRMLGLCGSTFAQGLPPEGPRKFQAQQHIGLQLGPHWARSKPRHRGTYLIQAGCVQRHVRLNAWVSQAPVHAPSQRMTAGLSPRRPHAYHDS